MFNINRLAAAIIAASLIAGPALAQGASPATGISQPAVKADASKSTTKMSVKHVGKTSKHAAKVMKHRKHVAHVKHGKSVKHVKHPAKIKTVG